MTFEQEVEQAFADRAAMERFMSFIRRALGVNLSGKESLVRQRLQSLLWERRTSLGQLCDELTSGTLDQAVLHDLLHRITTHHTYFFRDAEQFTPLVDEAASTQKASQGLRIWCAACSSGEEPYTLAMLLAERLGLDVFKRTVSILATDISLRATEYAESGVYPIESIDRVPEAMRRRYMARRDANSVLVSSALRERCTFRRLNLQLERYPLRGPFDWIVCRNVLIYYDQRTRASTLRALGSVARHGTGLILGMTETVSDPASGWKSAGGHSYRWSGARGER